MNHNTNKAWRQYEAGKDHKRRIGLFENGKIFLEDGAQFTLTVRDVMGDASCVSVIVKNVSPVRQLITATLL